MATQKQLLENGTAILVVIEDDDTKSNPKRLGEITKNAVTGGYRAWRYDPNPGVLDTATYDEAEAFIRGTVAPHDAFAYWRADEVAECLDGVTPVPGLYEALWEIVGKQEPIPNIEDSGPTDHVGHENLSSHWGDLKPEFQIKLNELMDAYEAKIEGYAKEAT